MSKFNDDVETAEERALREEAIKYYHQTPEELREIRRLEIILASISTVLTIIAFVWMFKLQAEALG